MSYAREKNGPIIVPAIGRVEAMSGIPMALSEPPSSAIILSTHHD